MSATSADKTGSLIKHDWACWTLLLVLALGACGKETSHPAQIVGTWAIEEADMTGSLTLSADNSFTAKTNDGTLAGTWKIEDDRLIGTVSTSTIPSITQGYSWSNVIVEVSNDSLALMSRAGKTENYHRVR